MIKIGYSISLTGQYAAMAHGQQLTALLWEEMINEGGGLYIPEYDKKIPVELIYYDDESLTDKTLQNYSRLLEVDDVDLLFPPSGTTTHIALAPFVEQNKIPVVGATAASLRLRELDIRYMWFVTAAMPDRQMQALVDLMKTRKEDINTVAVAYAQIPFPRENFDQLIPLLKQEGFEVVAELSYPADPDDLSSMILELADLNPDAFLGLSYPPDAFLITQQAAEYGFNPKLFQLLVGPAISVYPEMFNEEGVIFMGKWMPEVPWPGARQFWDQFNERWNEPPDILDSIETIQSIQVMQQAVEAVGLDWEKLRDYIASSEFETVGGPVKFDGVENVALQSTWQQWQGGVPQIVWPGEYATSELVFPKPAWP